MDTVSEIKRILDPVEYIGRAVQLQKAGRNFKALCPFHNEKTPSFYVFPDRGTWRCFGSCGEGGDLFTFVQKRDNVDFREALRSLASDAGIELSPQSAKSRSRADHLGGVVSRAVDFYEGLLWASEGAEAREYLVERRGLTQETIRAFRMGFAPDDWRSLRDHLLAKGYSDADGVAAGLLVEREEGGDPYDRFRGRVIVPITDERGAFVGLGGRALGEVEPKYLNSPQTEIFDKSSTLFALDRASASARETGTVIVVEGYMDVIGPWQAGFKNVVATMGTSLTERHAQLLARRAKRVVLAMDPDAAGLNAAERAGDLFLGMTSPDEMARTARSADRMAAAGAIDLRVAPLPPGQDPDDLAREAPGLWRDAINAALPFAAFLLDRLVGEDAPAQGIETRQALDRLVPVVRSVSDPVERGTYVQRVARRLGVREEAVLERMRVKPNSPRREEPPSLPNFPGTPPSRLNGPTVEELLLATAFAQPALRGSLRVLPPDLFTEALDREAFLRWCHEETDGATTEDEVQAHIERLRSIRQPVLAAEAARRRASDLIRHILRERLIQRQSAVTQELADAEQRLGASRVQQVAHSAWMGDLPDDDAYAVAQTVMEEMELGLSIHKREGPALG